MSHNPEHNFDIVTMPYTSLRTLSYTKADLHKIEKYIRKGIVIDNEKLSGFSPEANEGSRTLITSVEDWGNSPYTTSAYLSTLVLFIVSPLLEKTQVKRHSFIDYIIKRFFFFLLFYITYKFAVSA